MGGSQSQDAPSPTLPPRPPTSSGQLSAEAATTAATAAAAAAAARQWHGRAVSVSRELRDTRQELRSLELRQMVRAWQRAQSHM
jgi:hypothetical protein